MTVGHMHHDCRPHAPCVTVVQLCRSCRQFTPKLSWPATALRVCWCAYSGGSSVPLTRGQQTECRLLSYNGLLSHHHVHHLLRLGRSPKLGVSAMEEGSTPPSPKRRYGVAVLAVEMAGWGVAGVRSNPFCIPGRAPSRTLPPGAASCCCAACATWWSST